MNAQALIERMAITPAVVSSLTSSLRDDDLRFKPESGAWSILEVLCHLGDEEVDDFRARLRSTIESPDRAWQSIDPEGWAKARNYNAQNPGVALERFMRERSASLAWLRGLGSVDWSTAHVHPKFGAIRAGDLLAAWAAHDTLHIRQIAKRLYDLSGRDSRGFTTIYAGQWGA